MQLSIGLYINTSYCLQIKYTNIMIKDIKYMNYILHQSGLSSLYKLSCGTIMCLGLIKKVVSIIKLFIKTVDCLHLAMAVIQMKLYQHLLISNPREIFHCQTCNTLYLEFMPVFTCSQCTLMCVYMYIAPLPNIYIYIQLIELIIKCIFHPNSKTKRNSIPVHPVPTHYYIVII